MPSLIISSASRSSPCIFIYHSSYIILFPSSCHSLILAFFNFPLIHFTIELFAISSKLIFTHFIYHTLLFIIPYSFPSYFNSITLFTTHLCFSFLFASMFSIHSFRSISIPFFQSTTPITLTLIHFHSIPLIPFRSIILIHFLSLFWLLILIYSVVPCSSLPTLFNFIHFYSHSSIFHSFIAFISFLRFSSSFLNYEINPSFVRILVIALSFVLLIRNTLCYLEVPAFTFDDWFESSGIEWWGNGRMNTWRLNGIGVIEAVIIEVDSIRW